MDEWMDGSMDVQLVLLKRGLFLSVQYRNNHTTWIQGGTTFNESIKEQRGKSIKIFWTHIRATIFSE